MKLRTLWNVTIIAWGILQSKMQSLKNDIILRFLIFKTDRIASRTSHAQSDRMYN